MMTNDIFDIIYDAEQNAKDFGFYWSDIRQLLDQIHSECDEIQAAWNNNDIENLDEEIGDLIHAAICLSIFCRINPRESTLKAHEKFKRRFNNVVHLAHAEGQDSLKGSSFDILMDFWRRAKKL